MYKKKSGHFHEESHNERQSSFSVYEGFHSKVLASPAEDVVRKESENKKHEHQINMAQTISKSKDTLFFLFERSRDMIVQLLQKIHATTLFSEVNKC